MNSHARSTDATSKPATTTKILRLRSMRAIKRTMTSKPTLLQQHHNGTTCPEPRGRKGPKFRLVGQRKHGIPFSRGGITTKGLVASRNTSLQGNSSNAAVQSSETTSSVKTQNSLKAVKRTSLLQLSHMPLFQWQKLF